MQLLLQLFVCEIATLPVSNNEEISPELPSEQLRFFQSAIIGKAEAEKTTIARNNGSNLRKRRGSNTETESNHRTNFGTNSTTTSVIAEKSDNFRTLTAGKKSTKGIDIDSSNIKRTTAEISEEESISNSSTDNENTMVGLARAFGLLGKTLMLVPLIIG